MRAGYVTPVEGYDHIENPLAVVVGTSWSTAWITHEEARAAIRAYGCEPVGEPTWDLWRSVIKGDDYRYDDWHSDASGKRTVEILVFATDGEQ